MRQMSLSVAHSADDKTECQCCDANSVLTVIRDYGGDGKLGKTQLCEEHATELLERLRERLRDIRGG